MFSAGSFDQTIERVVGIRQNAGSFLISEKHLRYVFAFDVCNVADRVEGVMQILKRVVVLSFCLQTDESESFFIVRISRSYIVAVSDPAAQSLFVVVDV